MISGNLKIYPILDTQDFAKSGYWSNVDIGIKQCPTLKYLPFYFGKAKGYTVSEFKLRKLSFSGRTKTVLSTISLSTSLVVKSAGTFFDTFSYYANTEQAATAEGYYEFYIKMSDDTEYISEIMNIPVVGQLIPDLADYNVEDHSNDLYV